MGRFFDFAIIRAVPDPRRGEFVNIGVLVYGPEAIDVRLLPSLSKLRAMDATVELSLFHDFEENVNQLVENKMSIEQKHALLSRLGFVELSDLGQFEAQREVDYERCIDNLMNKLVRPKKRPRKSKKHGRISTNLRDAFDAMKILGHEKNDIDKHLIVPNFPIDQALEINADFALRNGSMHVLQTIDFRVKSGLHTDKFREACEVYYSIKKAINKFGDNTESYVVYAADKLHEVERHIEAMSESAGELINFNEYDERIYLLEKLRDLSSEQYRIDK